MNKEKLEELKKYGKNVFRVERDDRGNEWVKMPMEEYKKIVDELTPPTKEEVCEEIGYYFYKCVGWMNVHVEYDKVNKSFIVEHDDKKRTYCELIENIQTIQFYTDIPIFIAKHIAQFYEKESERE
jgi:hypothetical protein